MISGTISHELMLSLYCTLYLSVRITNIGEAIAGVHLTLFIFTQCITSPKKHSI